MQTRKKTNVYRGKSSNHRPVVEKLRVQLFCCGALLFAVLAVKLLLPEAAQDLSRDLLRILNGDVDYRAAFVSVGEALGGSRDFGEAMTEAGSIFFAIPEAG